MIVNNTKKINPNSIFKSLPDNFDIKKYEEQKNIINLWRRKSNHNGIFEAETGFGKTFVFIMAIKFCKIKEPDFKITILTPTLSAYNNIKTLIDKEGGFTNTEIYTIQTYSKLIENTKKETDLLIIDEVHLFTSKIYGVSLFNNLKYKCFLGATAKIEDNFMEREVANKNFNIFYKLNRKTTIDNKWTSGYKHLFYKVNISEEEGEILDDINKNIEKYKNYFCDMSGYFNINLVDLFTGRLDYDKRYNIKNRQLDHLRFLNIENLTVEGLTFIGHKLNKLFKERRELILLSESKINFAYKLLTNESFIKDRKVIVFSERIQPLISLYKKLKLSKTKLDIYNYHSKINSTFTVISPNNEIVIKGIKLNKETVFEYQIIKYYKKVKNKKLKFTSYANLKDFIVNEFGKDFKIKRVSNKKIKENNLLKFKNNKNGNSILLSAVSLDIAENIPDVNTGLTLSSKSKKTQTIQRKGRLVRIENISNKPIVMIDLYLKNVRAEINWVENRKKAILKEELYETETLTELLNHCK